MQYIILHQLHFFSVRYFFVWFVSQVLLPNDICVIFFDIKTIQIMSVLVKDATIHIHNTLINNSCLMFLSPLYNVINRYRNCTASLFKYMCNSSITIYCIFPYLLLRNIQILYYFCCEFYFVYVYICYAQ